MKLSGLPTLGEVLERQREDPEFKEAWDRFHLEVCHGAVELTA